MSNRKKKIDASKEGVDNLLNAMHLTTPVRITAATIKDGFCTYYYDLKVNETVTDKLKRNSGLLVHIDLLNAFKKLNPHLAVICEEINAFDITDIEKIVSSDDEEAYDKLPDDEKKISDIMSQYSVTGFTIDSTGENEGVSLVGTKKLSTGEPLKLDAPKKKYNGNYHFINEFRVAVDACVFEVSEYMNGKGAPIMVQTDMDFPSEDETEPDNEQ